MKGRSIIYTCALIYPCISVICLTLRDPFEGNDVEEKNTKKLRACLVHRFLTWMNTVAILLCNTLKVFRGPCLYKT